MIIRSATLAEVERRWADRFVDPDALTATACAALHLPPGIGEVVGAWRARTCADLVTSVELARRALVRLPDGGTAGAEALAPWRVRALLSLSAGLADLGLRDEALVLNEQALQLAVAVGFAEGRLVALHDRGMLFTDAPDRSLAYLLEALDEARDAGDARVVALALRNIGESHPELVSDADLADAQQAVTPVVPGLACALAELRVARYLDRGEPDAARGIADAMPDLPPLRDAEAYVDRTLARAAVARHEGATREAVALLRAADALTSGHLHLRVAAALSLALEADGHLAEALAVERALRVEETEITRAERASQGIALEVHYRSQRAGEDIRRERERADELAHLVATLEAEADRLRESGRRDTLTGLYNRRYLTEVLPPRVTRAVAAGIPVGVAVIDLDRFKQLNDGHGHQAGDQALRAVTAVLRRIVGDGDVLVRHGGDEFVVVRIGSGGSDTLALDLAPLSDAVRTAVDAAVGPVTGPVTASVGVAEVVDRLDTAIVRADQRMYVAKSGAGTDLRPRLVRPVPRSA